METFATPARETADLAFVHAAHDAFRRDVDRLAAVVAAGKDRAPHVRAGWENLKEQLHLHFQVEESLLWPRVARAVRGRPVELAVLADVQEGHARIEPLVVAVDAALEQDDPSDRANLEAAVAALRTALDVQLRHEDTGALPLARSVLGPEEWRGLRDALRRECGTHMTRLVPWIVDGIGPIERSRFLTALPRAVQEDNRLTWEPRYRKRRLWSV
ncbi:hemerythrin domain-containing protein [Actinomadura litoris]|uniref:Hemerythrin domain-containing protein n=1 Tax=Actinomadura litoris TaxID=2678616 RepID=A0A7K1KZT7_9ACTN|nr:hemerythrin domain-containing protein [Actinomadura litoris]MUN37486.1 hemerythrin domain-containing protein [Actinomadura litoris]